MSRRELAAALRRGGFSGIVDRAASFHPQGCMMSDQGELGVYYYGREFGNHRLTQRLMFFSASEGYLGMYDVPGPPVRVERDRVVYDLPAIEGTEIRLQDGHLPRTVLLDGEVKNLFR